MARHGNLCLPLVLFSAAVVLAGCNSGASVSGTFDRNYNVSGPIRLELTNASGDVDITGSADGKVHVRGEVRASGFGFENPQTRLDDTLANPPIEQRGDTIRIGKEMSRMRNISIAYTIRVPRDTEVSSTLASGAQTIRGVRGPVKVQAASGVIRVEKIERDTQLTTLSGTVSATDIGNDVRVSSASGSVTVSNARGDVRVNAISGIISVSNPGGRIEADTALRTVSGAVQLGVPASANLHLSAEAVSGEIRTDIPIVIEEQNKHSLRAHMGSGGGRVDVHTVSGEIRLSGTK